MAVNCDLARLVKNISRPRDTREEVIAYYQARYPGYQKTKNGDLARDSKGNPKFLWKEKIVEALLNNVTDKKGNPYKRTTLTRRFQTGRESTTKVQPHQQKEYRTLGAKLPYIPPEEGIGITGQLCMHYADDPCEDRQFDIQMVGEDFDFFLQSYELQSIVNVYMFYPADYGMRDNPLEIPALWACECPGNQDCQWENIQVTPIEEGEVESKQEPNKGYGSKSGGSRPRRSKEKSPKKPRSPKTFERGPTLTPDQVTDLRNR